MSDTTVAIVTAGIAAVVTVVGWNVSHYLAKGREDRTRRIESSVNRIERQIEEFYGPLLSLIEQIFNVWRVRKKIFDSVNSDNQKAIDEFVWSEYFQPLHREIQTLIKVKFYLVDDPAVAANIKEYLEHSMQELFQARISKELHISTAQIEGKRWPRTFHSSVKKAIEELQAKRDSLIRDLEV